MDQPSRLGPWPAGLLVFGSSGAVLVVELASLRLLAPYLGLTLETNTLVIGLALAAIAAGSWLGGLAADRYSPRSVLGPLLGLAGGAVALLPGAVRWAGATGDPGVVQLTSMAAIAVPAALLAAVTPMVTKLRLSSLDETGTVVGRLSGIGTVGAIAGTVLTGFVLVSVVPVSTILVGLGILLVVSAVVVDVGFRGWPTRGASAAAVVVGVGGLAVAVAPGGCDVETTYHCVVVRVDPERDSGRVLVMDGLRHSYVDLDDPAHLEFAYIRAMAAVADTAYVTDEPLRAYHLGGGGLTLPRYLDMARPGTDSLVSEIDPGVVDINIERLGLRTGDGIEVRVEDGRAGLRRLVAGSQDLVVGDAFGGVSVPFHLTTVEALADVRRVLAPAGLYVANLIDHPPLGFARAEVMTLAATFDDVALAASPETLAGEDGGNLVVAAGDRTIDVTAWQAQLDRRDTGWSVIEGSELERWIGDASVLRDDYAPVDQLLNPYG